MKHLKVLAEIGQSHSPRPALLSDLKATYKWLNEHANDIFTNIVNENSNKILHSASCLVRDLQDVGELQAPGVRAIRKVKAKHIAVVDKTSVYRRLFCDFRKRGFEVNVTFRANDDEYEIMPAHKS